MAHEFEAAGAAPSVRLPPRERALGRGAGAQVGGGGDFANRFAIGYTAYV